LAARPGAVSINPRFRAWAEQLRAKACIDNIVFSKEIDVMTELNNIIAGNPAAVLAGYNMAYIDALATQDAALRCGVKSLFDVASQHMDLYRSPVVKTLRNIFQQGCGRCRTDLQLLRRIIELASPGYFQDVVGNAHDAACDAHVLRYYTRTVHVIWSCL